MGRSKKYLNRAPRKYRIISRTFPTGRRRKKKSDDEGSEYIGWDGIFDILSSEYGWTTKQILKLTVHEINWRLVKINKRKNNKLKFEASIHGIDLGKTEEQAKAEEVKLSDAQEEAIKKAQEESRQRKKKEFHGRKIDNPN
jgi:hypothetical protein